MQKTDKENSKQCVCSVDNSCVTWSQQNSLNPQHSLPNTQSSHLQNSTNGPIQACMFIHKTMALCCTKHHATCPLQHNYLPQQMQYTIFLHTPVHPHLIEGRLSIRCGITSTFQAHVNSFAHAMKQVLQYVLWECCECSIHSCFELIKVIANLLLDLMIHIPPHILN
jgi:hypothetical protein